MRKGTLLVMIAGAAALAAGLTGTVGAQGQGQGQGADRTIVVYEKDDGGSFRFVDAKPFTRVSRRGPRRISPGDAFFIRAPQYSDAATTQRVGTVAGSCRSTNGARRFDRVRWLCDGVFQLADGTVDFHGAFVGEPQGIVFAVTGGTQAYEAAGGQISFEEQPDGKTKLTIHLVGK